MSSEGIEVRLNAKCLAVGAGRLRRGGHRRLREPARRGSAARTCCWRSAACPTPTTSGWNRAGIQTDQRGYIVVDDELRTSVPGVWALGDCNGHGAFTHTSYNDYEIVADNLLNDAGRKVNRPHRHLRACSPTRRSAASA